MSVLDSKIPKGPLAEKWTNHKNDINLVNPANKRNIDVIVIGTGLAGGAAAATLAELGYNVKTAIVDISQEGFRNVAFDFVNDPTANISLELTQTGDNLFFQREGTNSIIESLQFNQTVASPSIIVKNIGN